MATRILFVKLLHVVMLVGFGEKRCRKNLPLSDKAYIMPIWKFHVTPDAQFAQLLNLWVSRPSTVCDSCGGHTYEPIDHLEVEWDDGSDQIPDFVFAIGPTIVRRSVADDLLTRFRGFAKGEIRMPDHPNLRRPEAITKRTAKRIWLPYEGPELCYLACDEVDIHPKTTATVDKDCSECGSKTYKRVSGIETKNSRSHVLRQSDCGLFFSRDAIGDRDIFRPRHMGFNLCTDRVRDFVRSQCWTNVEFLEVGDILR